MSVFRSNMLIFTFLLERNGGGEFSCGCSSVRYNNNAIYLWKNFLPFKLILILSTHCVILTMRNKFILIFNGNCKYVAFISVKAHALVSHTCVTVN